MRLLDLVLAAISSMRAPASPYSANSAVATSMMFYCVPSGSCMRVPLSPRAEPDLTTTIAGSHQGKQAVR